MGRDDGPRDEDSGATGAGDRFLRTAEIVEECLALSPSRRAGHLIRACSGDDALLEDALGLLLATLEAEAVETPPFDPFPRGPASSERPTEPMAGVPKTEGAEEPEPGDGGPGRRIGPFRLLGELGQGGMGTVYLAEQTRPVRRRVALKVAREWLEDSARLRLAAERQAMARLSHDNVARIFEAGQTADGHPWFAMEFVEGARLTEWCDRQRLGIEERLRLFLEVCSGVEHAHRHGIIHRDLKPSNVLVAEGENGGRPKIIDFGIAKATDGGLLERSLMTGERVLGTPAYLSPEAISDPDRVDTRSDVYSLGVILQELLIGVRLVPERDGESAIVLLRRVLEEDPPSIVRRWRELDEEARREALESRGLASDDVERRIRGDLGWIVRRATVREMGERYSGVAELAADIRRHLEHLPVLAGPPDTTYRLRKLVRRHRAAFAFSAALLTALVGGFVARTIEARRATHEAAEAIRAREETEEVVTYLTDLFVSADPQRNLGEEPTATELLERGVEKLRGEAFGDRPAIRSRLLHTTAKVLWRLGRIDSGRSVAEEALALREEHDVGAGDLADSLSLVARLAGEADDHERAERLLLRAIDLRERESGAASVETALLLVDLAAVYEEARRYEEALPIARRALTILERELGSDDPRVLRVTNNLATLFGRAGRPEEAEASYRRVLELKRATLPERHPSIALTLVNLGNLLAWHRQPGEALVYFEEARDIESEVLGPEHPDFALTLNSYGTALRSLGRWGEADRALRQALAIFESAWGPEHAYVAVALHNLGAVAEGVGDLETARELYRRALAIRTEVAKPPARVSSALRLARVERRRGDPEASERLLATVAELTAGQDPGTSRRRLWAAEHGWVALGRGDTAEAERHFELARAGEVPDTETAAEAVSSARIGLAVLARDRRDLAAALDSARRGRELLATVFAPEHVEMKEVEDLIRDLEREL